MWRRGERRWMGVLCVDDTAASEMEAYGRARSVHDGRPVWGRRAGGQGYRGVADDDGAGRRALPPAGKMEAFAMKVYRAGAGQRSFSLPLTYCVLAVTVLLETGSATQQVRPDPYEKANTETWFSQSGSSEQNES